MSPVSGMTESLSNPINRTSSQDAAPSGLRADLSGTHSLLGLILAASRVQSRPRSRDPNMTMLSEAKLVVLDVETTGLSPAMGDRVVELGMIAAQGETEISRTNHLINPGRPIRWDAQRVHGISDQDV